MIDFNNLAGLGTGILFPTSSSGSIPNNTSSTAGGFSWGDFMNTAGGALGELQNGNGAGAGNLIAGGATAALTAVNPVLGLAVGAALESIDFGKNFNLVSKYGLSSWGASGSPSQAKSEWAESLSPPIQAMAENLINREDLGNAITELRVFLDAVYHWAVSSIPNAKAKSTRQGREWRRDNAKKMRVELVDNFVKELRKAGVLITEQTVPITQFDFSVPYVKDKLTLNQNSFNSSTKTVKYTVVIPEALKKKYAQLQKAKNANGENLTQKEVAEELEKSASTSKIGMIVLAIIALFFGKKLLKTK